MKQTGYHKAMKKEFEGREKPTVKIIRMTPEERERRCNIRRKLEDIKIAKELNKEWELF